MNIRGNYGITLIALVISIIVMLILAGVSLNATIGENGIITRAKESKMVQGLAILQEQIEYRKIEEMNERLETKISDFSYDDYPQKGFLKRVSYGSGDTYVFDLNYIDRLGDNIKNSIVGGEGVNGTLNLLRNVYGVNDDFKVWYIDEDGKMYGAEEIREIGIDVSLPISASEGIKEALGLGENITVGDVRGKQKVSLDGNSMTNQITNVNELAIMPNLKELTLKNLTLTDLEGLQYLSGLDKLWLDNVQVADYSGLRYCINLTGFYPINGSVTEDNIVEITNQFANMPKLDTVRLRNNSTLTMIPALTTLGNIKTLYIEENENLTNIYGLSTVNNKMTLTSLYLNENNLTDVVTTTEVDETYGYLKPILTDGNIINMSYIGGYTELSTLNCGYIGSTHADQAYRYENQEYDLIVGKNSNLNYLNGVKNSVKTGISNLTKLTSLYLNGCNILNIDNLLVNTKISTLNLLENNNMTNAQINSIANMLNNVGTLKIDGKFLTLLNSNKEVLNYSNFGVTDLSFLDGNTITKSLDLSSNKELDDSQTRYIASMIQLKYLNLNNCYGITDFSFLNNLPNLEYLLLIGTKVKNEDIFNLSCKNSLRQLNLLNCTQLSDLSILNAFSNEVYSHFTGNIDLRGWNISSKQDMSILNSKKYTSCLLRAGNLTSMQNAISNFSAGFGLHLACNPSRLLELEKCTEITYLKMSANGETSNENYFEGENSLNLSNCKSLGEIYFYRTSIESLNVTGCTALEKATIFDMEKGSKWNVSDFSKNSNLNYLSLTKNYLEQSDLERIIGQVEPIYINENLQSGCPKLETLYLNRNSFSSLEPLAKLAGKTADLSVYISDNQLVTLSGIEDLTQLVTLDIQNNTAITNITPILTLKSKSGNKLKSVNVKNCTGITEDMKNQMRNAGITVGE